MSQTALDLCTGVGNALRALALTFISVQGVLPWALAFDLSVVSYSSGKNPFAYLKLSAKICQNKLVT